MTSNLLQIKVDSTLHQILFRIITVTHVNLITKIKQIYKLLSHIYTYILYYFITIPSFKNKRTARLMKMFMLHIFLFSSHITKKKDVPNSHRQTFAHSFLVLPKLHDFFFSLCKIKSNKNEKGQTLEKEFLKFKP